MNTSVLKVNTSVQENRNTNVLKVDASVQENMNTNFLQLNASVQENMHASVPRNTVFNTSRRECSIG